MGRNDEINVLERKLLTRGKWQGSCFIWPQKGRGLIWVNCKVKKVYRVAWEIWIGPIPIGYDIDHLCHNIRCYNIFHLEPVTHKENTNRGFNKTTHCKYGHKLVTVRRNFLGPTRSRCRICSRIQHYKSLGRPR